CLPERPSARLIHQGNVHLWLVPPLQVQISCWVPSVVLLPGSSRHLAEPVPTSDEFAPTVHCWLVPPVQVHSSTSTPLAVPFPVTSRQAPLCWIVAPATVHCCAASAALQLAITTGVPFADPPAARHLPASPEVIGPAVGLAPVTLRLSNWSVWYPTTPKPACPAA